MFGFPHPSSTKEQFLKFLRIYFREVEENTSILSVSLSSQPNFEENGLQGSLTPRPPGSFGPYCPPSLPFKGQTGRI